MTLHEFLSTFISDAVMITLIENDVEIITFKAPGYTHLDDELESRQILSWTITSPIAVKITLVPETTEP